MKTIFGTIDKKLDVYLLKDGEFSPISYYRIKDLYDPMTGFNNVEPREGSRVFYDYIPYERFKSFKPGTQVRITYNTFRNRDRYYEKNEDYKVILNILSVSKLETINYKQQFKLIEDE